MKIGVVGLGFMGVTHLQAYRQVAGAEVAAIVSSDPEKRKGKMGDLGGNLDLPTGEIDFEAVRAYSEIGQLLQDSEVDAVDLCVPTSLHAPLARRALQAGKHVLVEKPMALDVESCREMMDAASSAAKVLMVAQVVRFWPGYRDIRPLLRSGKLGRVRHLALERKCGKPGWGGWLEDPSASGGGAFDLLVHDFDYALYLLGMPDTLSARGFVDEERGLDLLDASLRYKGGVQASVRGGWYPPDYPFSMKVTVMCDEGTLEFGSEDRRLLHFSRGGEVEEMEIEEGDGFAPELEAFVRACKEEKKEVPECPPEDSARAVHLALSALESRKRGATPLDVSKIPGLEL